MDVRRGVWWAVVLAALAGCGGSGSSGFDPSFIEGALIDQAIAEQRCVTGDGALTICASGATVPVPSGGLPSPGDLHLVAGVHSTNLVDCRAGGTPCEVSVDVDVAGQPLGSELRVAYRLLPGGDWSVGPVLQVQTSSDGTGMVAPQTIALGDADAARQVQVAVLLFRAPPASVPAHVAELRDTGADYAFVLPPQPIVAALSSS